jgi:hypothetical protein
MSLSINDKKESAGNGIVIQVVSIITAEDVSNTTPPFLTTPCDLGVKLTLDIGRDFQPEFTITGGVKRETVDGHEGVITGWGGAFKVRDFFSNLGIGGDLIADDDKYPTIYSIPTTMLEEAKGKQFKRLSYISGVRPSGKTRWADWTEIASINESDEAFVKRFEKGVAKGFPSNYKPETGEVTNGSPF